MQSFKLSLSQVKTAADIPAEVAAEAIRLAKSHGRRIVYRSVYERPYYPSEGARVTAHYAGQALTVETTRSEAVTAAPIVAGAVQPKAGLWLVSEAINLGVWDVTIVSFNVPELSAPVARLGAGA